MKQSRIKRGNSLVDLELFRERMEELTDHAKQKEIEEKADIKPGGLSRLYYGEDAITIDHLIKISKAYNCSIDYLLGRDSIDLKHDISVKDIIETIHALCEMGSVIMTDQYHYVLDSIEVDTVAICVRNRNLNAVLKQYCSLRKALDVLDSELKQQVYESWLNSQLKKISESNDYSIEGDTMDDESSWELEKD